MKHDLLKYQSSLVIDQIVDIMVPVDGEHAHPVESNCPLMYALKEKLERSGFNVEFHVE
jgi:hypothetical protein